MPEIVERTAFITTGVKPRAKTTEKSFQFLPQMADTRSAENTMGNSGQPSVRAVYFWPTRHLYKSDERKAYGSHGELHAASDNLGRWRDCKNTVYMPLSHHDLSNRYAVN